MIEWIATDSVVLRDFLLTPAGQKLMEVIKRPKSEADTIEKTALLARYADGIEKVKDLITALASFQEPVILDPGFLSWDKDNK